MKQTNNAIKFLMAQYRAIFKHAYLKGLVSAAVLTAGLVTGSAQAAVDGRWDSGDFTTTPSGAFTDNVSENLTGVTNIDFNDANTWKTPGHHFTGGSAGTTANHAEINIIGAINHAIATSNFTLENSYLSIENTNKTNTTLSSHDGTSLNTGTIGANYVFTSNSSTIELTKSAINYAQVDLNDSSVILGGIIDCDAKDSAPSLGNDKKSRWAFYSNISANDSHSFGTLTVSDSSVTLNHESGLNADNTLTVSGESIITFNGKEYKGTSAEKNDKFSTAFLRAGNGDNTIQGTVIITSGTATGGAKTIPQLIVSDSSHGAIYANTINLTSANLAVGNEGVFKLQGNFSQKVFNNANGYQGHQDEHEQVALTTTNITTDNKGTIIIGDAATVGTWTVDGDSKFTGELINYTDVTVNGNDTGAGILTISESEILKTQNSDQKIIDGMFARDGKNSITLKSGGGLVLVDTDADGLDLNKDVTIVSATNVNAGTSSLGAIVVSGANTSNFIQGEHLVLKNKLDLTTNTEALSLKGNILEIGSDTTKESSLTTMGLTGLIGFDEVNLNTSGETFTIDKDVNLSRDFYEKDSSGNYTTTVKTHGLIKGDNINANGGWLAIRGGDWKNEDQSITLTNGGVLVQASEPISTDDKNIPVDYDDDGTLEGKYFRNANPAKLTWNGKFNINGNTANDASVQVFGASGADAVLDLTSADIFWGSGSITVSGSSTNNSETDPFATAGEGILKLTSAQFDTYIRSTSGIETLIELNNSGRLDVDGGISKAINFDEFVNDSATPSRDEGKVNFSGTGTLAINGGISLVTGINTTTEQPDSGSSSLDIGSGTIEALSIAINNRSTDIDPEDVSTDVVTIDSGTLAVSSSLDSDNTTIKFGTDSANLILNTANGADTGSVTADLEMVDGASIDVNNGQWTAQNISFSGTGGASSSTLNIGVSNYPTYYKIQGGAASLTAQNLSVESGNTTVVAGSFLTVDTIQAGSTAIFDVFGTMNINGRNDIDVSDESKELVSVIDNAETAGVNLTDATFKVSGPNAHLVFDNAATDALVDISYADAKDGNLVDVNPVLDDAKITLENFAELKLTFDVADGHTLTADEALELKKKLVDSGLDTGDKTGFLTIAGADIAVEFDGDTNDGRKHVAWSKVSPFSNVFGEGVTTENLKNAVVTNVSFQDEVSGHYGAILTNFDSSTGQLRVNGNLGLHNAYQNNFIAYGSIDANGAVVYGPVGAHLQGNSNMLLVGEGTIGKISSDSIGETQVTFAESETRPGTTTVEGSITDITELQVNNNADVKGNIKVDYLQATHDLNNATYDTTVNEIDLWSGKYQTNNLTITANNADSLIGGYTTVANKTVFGNKNTAQATQSLYVTGSLSTSDLEVYNGSSVHVGWESEGQQDDPDTQYFNESVDHSGILEVTGTATLNSGSIVLDPEMSLPASLGAINKFSGSSTNTFDAGKVDGSLFVGQNSALGIGVKNIASFTESLGDKLVDGHLAGNYGAMMYLSKFITVNAGEGIVMTAQSIKDFSDHINSSNSAFKNQLDAKSYTLADTMYFGDGTALIVDNDVLHDVYKNNNALVTFANDATLVADGGEILISGDVRANRAYTFFTDASGAVEVKDITGDTTNAAIEVKTENGFLVGQIDNTNGGKVTLGVVENARGIMAGASDPVYTTLVAYARGYNGDTETEESMLYDGYTEVTGQDGVTKEKVKNANYNNDILQYTISTGNGSATEQVARLGIYGGSVQAAISAGATTSDAVSARMGMSAQTGSVTFADNGQGAGLWVSPIYKSHDSDGFGTQGLSYGADMDLYGVALGGDFTMANGFRAGAAFNVGSGDADGQGAGTGVSNDFDYYGFTVYGGYTMDNMSVVGDISYTVVDNDVSANTALGKVSSTMDTTNLSVGVTGQYTLSLDAVDVTPHAGLRYTYVDMDDYTVKGDADVAHYAGDSMSIFSIPVGVTFSKDIVAGGWTVKPSFDLTLTANVGDDEIDGSVTWAGVDNLKTNLTSEVVDTFTYGATAGISAKTGNFSLGLGVNYTGASSADEYSVNANARFMF